MRSYLPMLLAKETAGLLGLTGALCVCIHLLSAANPGPIPEPIHFNTVAGFREFAASKGLCFHNGTANGTHVENNFYVADHPMSFEDLALLSKKNCGLTPAWRGILWVALLDSAGTSLWSEQLGGSWRMWGNLVVAGDEDLLDRLEERYQSD